MYVLPSGERHRTSPRGSRAAACLLIISLLSGLLVSNEGARCGVQRWAVKTGKDAETVSITLLVPTPTSTAFLTDLTRFPAAQPWSQSSRLSRGQHQRKEIAQCQSL